MIAFALFGTFVLLRRFGLDDSGPLSALLLLGAMTGAFAGGMVLKGKSGWCSTICPLLPVQRIYGQTPLALIANAHCQPCVGCVKNCYDFNPRAAYLADLHDDDSYWSGYRRFFVGAFPGLVLGFFAIPDGPWHEVLGGIALCVAVSIASFAVLSTFVKTSPHTLTSLYGAVAFGIFYWYASTILPEALTWAVRAVGDRARRHMVRPHGPQGEAVPGPRERAAGAGEGVARGGRARGRPRRRRQRQGPRGHVRADEQARRAEAGPVAAGDRRGQRPADRGGLPDGHLRRRSGGDQGRDGVHVGDLRRRALDARTARPGLEHADGVLRARDRTGQGRPDAGPRRGAEHQPRRRTSTTTATSSASS